MGSLSELIGWPSYMGHDARKPVFGVSDKVRLNPNSSLIKTNYRTFQNANDKCAGQTVRMRRLFCALIVHRQQSQVFSSLRSPFSASVDQTVVTKT